MPDPQWSDAAAMCPACGYSLVGLTPPVPCPECGHLHSGRQFIVYGVPSTRSVMPAWRIACIIIIVTLAFLLMQTFPILIEEDLGALGLIMGIALTAGGVALAVTGRRTDGGSSRFIFVSGGVNVTPIRIDQTKGDSAAPGYIKFNGNERAQLKLISSVWAQLTITRPDRTKVFQAGIRCPRAQADQLLSTIDALIRGQAAGTGAAPPTH